MVLRATKLFQKAEAKMQNKRVKKDLSEETIVEISLFDIDYRFNVLRLGNAIQFLDELILASSLSDSRKIILKQIQESLAGRLIDNLEKSFGSRHDFLVSTADDIIAICERKWDTNKSDCNAFVKAVATDYGISLNGLADEIVTTILGAGWEQLGKDGVAAKAAADSGKLVIGGLKGSDHNPPRDHGHVVIVVSGPLARGKYPSGYWGSTGGVGKKNATLNYAWNADDRDNVVYGARSV